MDIIKNFENIFSNCFEPDGNKKFWIKGFNQQVISNPDESRVDILIVNFREYSLDDSDEDVELYTQEFLRFQEYFIETVQRELGITLKDLNGNGHYFCHRNRDGDTISVHFNDESLIYIETYTGQY